MAGIPGRYFALGVTSGARGYYAGVPVLDGSGKVIGVAAVKKTLEFLGADFQVFPYMLLTSPEGIIFISSRRELLFRSLWPVPAARQAELAASKQFGDLSFENLLPAKPVNGSLLNYQGADYYVTSFEVGNEGWMLFSFTGLGLIRSARFLGILITAVFCLFVLTSFLMLMESETMRETAEKLLKLKEEVKTLSGIVPICASCKKIRDDKGYWDRVETYVAKHTEAKFSHGLCPDCAKKLYPDYPEEESKK
jgi:C4-dicarboxylate-specific signal transduction histidine kinase